MRNAKGRSPVFPIRRAALALAAAVLAGCGDGPAGPDLAPQGEARFTYTGERSGEFAGSGQLNRRSPNSGSWAVGELQEGGRPVFGLFAQQRRADEKTDGLVIQWQGARVGSATCDANTESCPFNVMFMVGRQNATGQIDATYSRATGTLTVTELTAERARGTFAFTLLRQLTVDDPPSIQATGSFDVPIEDGG